MGEFDDIIKDFLVESYENLDQLDEDFVTLEDNPADPEILARIFRTIHTIKGTCGFLGFSKLEQVTHTGENLLGKLRDGELKLTEEMTSALLKMVDAVRQILSCIEQDKGEGDVDYDPLQAELTALLTPNTDAVQDTKAAPPEPGPEEATQPPAEAQSPPAGRKKPKAKKTRRKTAKAAKTAAAPPPAPTPEVAAPPAAEEAPESPKTPGVTETTIRVDVDLLDNLMNLVGELVLVRNQTQQITAEREDKELLSAAQRLDFITAELQEGFMKTRMQPIGNVWSKLPRLVREVARGCGKSVRLIMEGKETELDRTLLEAVKDPLTHAVRNAVDHGIETPEARRERGKSTEGHLTLRAFHEGGLVNIEIEDDGQGIDTDAVALKALDQKLITPQQLQRLSERETLALIFLPGFSTARTVTNVSGRGVGMDVVKNNIERIGGTIDIRSEVGRGTRLLIKIPLTLAIIPALVVTSCQQRFCIPQVSLVEIVRLKGAQAEGAIETVYGAPVYRLRGDLLPLIYLNRELQMEDLAQTAADEQQRINIVVLQVSHRQFGLIVDEINDTQEIVVKPLGRQLQEISTYAGATIMGDGRVALILDVPGLAQRTQIVSDAAERVGIGGQAQTAATSENADTVLLFRSPDDGRMAISLSHVARLEEVEVEAIEQVGGRKMVQYRGDILPLVDILSLIPERRQEPRDDETPAPVETPARRHVVVYEHDGRSLGLLVGPLIDILEVPFHTQGPSTRECVRCTLVIHERVTELLDMQAVVARAAPQAFAQTAPATAAPGAQT